MAIPLLAMGLGMFGGGMFLQSKADERDAENNYDSAQSWLDTNAEWSAANPHYQQRLNEGRSDIGFLGNDAASSQSLLESMRAQMDLERQQEQMDLQRQSNANTMMTAGTGLYKPAESRRAGIQQGIMQATDAIDNPTMTGMDAYQATLSTLKAILGDEAVMEGDIQAVRAAQGVDVQLANLMQQWNMGEIDGDTYKRQLAPILRRLNQGSLKEFNSAKSAAQKRAESLGYEFGNVRQFDEGYLQYQMPELEYGNEVPSYLKRPIDNNAANAARIQQLEQENERLLNNQGIDWENRFVDP